MRMTRFDAFRASSLQSRLIRVAAGAALCLSACTPLGEEGGSISRGDQAFAKGDTEEALAEYQLALLQGSTEASTFARVAHAYVALGRIDEAREYYDQAVRADSGLADQAAADFVHLARLEDSVGDRFGMASAVQTATEFRPGITLEDLAIPLAQHYSNVGEYGRALPFYQKALSAVDPDTMPGILFETAIAYDEVGDCESAVVYYEDYRDRLPAWRRNGEVNWRLGNCSFQLARLRRGEGDDEEALRHLETLLRVEEPRNLLAMGYFEKGEILGYRGECEAAIEAFQHVQQEDPSGGTGPLVDRAEERIDQIRFGGRFDRYLGVLRPGQVGESCSRPTPSSAPIPSSVADAGRSSPAICPPG